MPVRLLFTIAVAAFAAVFTGLNLDNKCNVWLFHHFEDVPVAASIFISFLAGVLVMLPFTIGRVRKVEVPVEVKPPKREKPSREERKRLREEKKARRGAADADNAPSAEGTALSVATPDSPGSGTDA